MCNPHIHYEDIKEYIDHKKSAIRSYHDKHNNEKKGHLLTHSSFLGLGGHAAPGTPCVHLLNQKVVTLDNKKQPSESKIKKN